MTESKVLSLYTAWRRADLMFYYWDVSPNKLPTHATWLYSPAGTSLCLAYALLFVVLEGFDFGKSVPDSINDDVKSIYQNLKSFRDAVFHVQNEVLPKKLQKIMGQKDSVKKVEHIHHEIGKHISALAGIPFPE